MDKKKIRDAAWYPSAVAICIGVVLYLVLSHFSSLWEVFTDFLGNFKALIIGCVIAYLVNPLACYFERVLTKVKKEKRRTLANGLAFLVVVLFMVFIVLILVPQLIESMELFAGNLNGYLATLNGLLESWGVKTETIDLTSFINSSEDILNSVSEYIVGNLESIINTSANMGKSIFQIGIAFILSIYLMGEKSRLMAGLSRLLKAACGEKRYGFLTTFLGQCDRICSRYIIYNIIDSTIVGVANAIFMTICGMQYMGLISVVVAITNLIPTFGPMIGMVVGGFVLLMVKPFHALIFIIFSLILQGIDGYVLKPKLFGDSLGVSGLWILVGVIVGGNMFGVVGILMAVPAVAIIDLIYASYFLPWLESRREMKTEA